MLNFTLYWSSTQAVNCSIKLWVSQDWTFYCRF